MTETLYRSRVPERPLRQAGNLSYLDFIRLVGTIWSEAHPEIPFVASGLSADAKYPCIVYALGNRVPFPNEPKAKQREVLVNADDENKSVIIMGQKFENFVKFSAVDKVEPDGAQVVEELIEEFEDFVIRYTPVFSKLGLNDLTYNRRLSDDEEPRQGEGVVERTVVYRVVTEKLISAEIANLESVFINVTVGEVAEVPCEDEDTDEGTQQIGHKLLQLPE